jgi:hypothetical protein
MNFITLTLGILLVGSGFVVLIHKLHDRSVHDALAVVRAAHGDTVRACAALVGLMVPIVSSIAGGLALLTLAVLSQARI